MRKLYFVRHGQTQWNAEHRICGVTDIPLTELGLEQAVQTGEEIRRKGIRADLILHSPLQRAVQTARAISEINGIPMQAEPRLIEQNFGCFEKTDKRAEEFQIARQQFAQRNGDGESLLQLAQRIFNLLDDLAKETDQRTFILVGHNGIGRMVHAYFHEMTNEEYVNHSLKNCEVAVYSFPEES